MRFVLACVASREERPTRSRRHADVTPGMGDRDAAARISAYRAVTWPDLHHPTRGHGRARPDVMAVTVAPGLEQHLRATVILLIRSDDPPDRVAAGVRAAVPDISATGMILATREEVIAGEVTGSSGRRWRPTDASGRLAGAGRPSHVAGPVTIPGGQLLMSITRPPRPGCAARRSASWPATWRRPGCGTRRSISHPRSASSGTGSWGR